MKRDQINKELKELGASQLFANTPTNGEAPEGYFSSLPSTVVGRIQTTKKVSTIRLLVLSSSVVTTMIIAFLLWPSQPTSIDEPSLTYEASIEILDEEVDFISEDLLIDLYPLLAEVDMDTEMGEDELVDYLSESDELDYLLEDY